MDHIYRVLESRAGLIADDGNLLTRTSKPCPDRDIDSQLESFLRDRAAQDAEIKLMRAVGSSYLMRCSCSFSPSKAVRS